MTDDKDSLIASLNERLAEAHKILKVAAETISAADKDIINLVKAHGKERVRADRWKNEAVRMRTMLAINPMDLKIDEWIKAIDSE